MSEDVTLKPCPFCGGGDVSTDKYVLDSEKRVWSAHCHNDRCPINPFTPMYDTKAKAIAAWNTRKGEDERIAQAVGIEKREARLNLENRMKEQLLEAVQAEREQIIKRLNRQIIGYIQDKSLDFETTATLKEATDIAIKIVKGE